LAKSKQLWVALILIALLLLLVGGMRFQQAWPIRSIKLKGSYLYVSEAALEEALADISVQSMLSPYLHDTFQEALSSLKWVKNATIHRLWPDALIIYFEEHEPYVQWCDTGYLSEDGVLIQSEMNDRDTRLVRLCGPEGTAQSVLSQYMLFKEMFSPLGLSLLRLELSERYAWQLQLSNGLLVKLGREHVSERLKNLIAHWNLLKHVIPAAAVVDLRYPNGIAVSHNG
jgi:cell division protein FtsQ